MMDRGTDSWLAALGLIISLLIAVSASGLDDGSTPSPGTIGPESAEQHGDRFFKQRSAGYLDQGNLESAAIDSAIAAYEKALEADSDELRLIFKLMEALYFKGYHVVTEEKLKREIYQRLVDLDERALDLVSAATGREDLESLSAEQQAELLRDVPGAAEAHYWAVTGWGLWGMTHNPLKALAKGVGPRIRDHSRLLTLIDEEHRDGAGLRMLGRFHTEAPKVPLITGWVDREEGLNMLRRAVEISRREPRNLLFLAEAILDYDSDQRPEALELLRELAAREPPPELAVEDSESLEKARQLLGELSPAEFFEPAAQQP